MGGAALDRTGNLNKVDAIVGMFNRRKVFRMAIAPEGTRKKVTGLKTGFYYIALKANVPIIPVAFDYGRKEVKLGAPFYPTGDIDNDLKIIAKHFVGVKGKIGANDFDTSVL
jgi:1-acyl-sn-glycerol-3-phosphate acyltransferase